MRLSAFDKNPLMNAARYEPVRSNTFPDIQPPSAIPKPSMTASISAARHAVAEVAAVRDDVA